MNPSLHLIGDTLKDILTNTWKVPTCGKCHEMAKKLNGMSVEDVRADLDALAEELHQNIATQKWTEVLKSAVEFESKAEEQQVGLMGAGRLAAAKVADTVLHATTGNLFYKSLLMNACDYVEKANSVCIHRSEKRDGRVPWGRIPKYECNCADVGERFCIITGTAHDRANCPQNNIAVCDGCHFHESE